MKKILLLALAGSMLLAGNCHAAGNVTVTDKTICIAPGDDSGHFYAKIENVRLCQYIPEQDHLEPG